MAQLLNCKSVDCGRGVQRDSVTDAHGHTHPKVRVACANCGIQGDWQEDDSLTRAIVAWNERHVPQANATHDDRAAEARERELVARERRRSYLEQQIEVYRAEAAHARLKAKDMSRAGDKESAATFTKNARAVDEMILGFQRQIEELA